MTAIINLKDKRGNIISLENGFPIYGKKTGKYWFAFNPHTKALGSSKVSEELAVEDLKDSIDAFIEIHLELSTLENALINLGWIKVNGCYQKPKFFNSPSVLAGVLNGDRQVQYAS